jgi:hypothetical protein
MLFAVFLTHGARGGATTLSIRTFSINDTQHSNTAIMLNVVMLSFVAPQRQLDTNPLTLNLESVVQLLIYPF